MLKASIELHDSDVTAIRVEGSSVEIDLKAYVHVSEGTPGIDAGTGWTRPVRMTVRDGVVHQRFDGEALLIADGTVRVGQSMLNNMLPLDLDVSESVEIQLVGAEGMLIVTGAGLRVEPMGDAVYVERFP